MRWLDKRWEPTGSDPYPMTMGLALAAGLAHAYQVMAKSGGDLDEDGATAEAVERLTLNWVEHPGHTLEGATQVLKKSIRAGLATDLLEGGTVVAVEKDLGGMRPDLIIRQPAGLAIIDHKWSEVLKPEWVESRHEQQNTDPQLWMYAAGAEDTFGETVIKVGFHRVTAAPRMRTWYEPVVVSPDRLQLFREDLAQAHFQMELEDATPDTPPMGRWTACVNRDENYGRCRFHDACHLCARDPERMKNLYNRRSG